jgi:transcription antitermination factor NusG
MSTSEEDLKWYALYCQPNWEQKVNDAIHDRLGLIGWYPFTSQWVAMAQKGRSRLVRRAWFPRYTFARSGDGDLHKLKDLNGVTAIVGQAGQPTSIPDNIMDRLIRIALPNGEIPQGKARKKRFQEGDIIKVVDETSPLVGLCLYFISGSSIIRAEEIESGLKVQIPLEYVERAGKSS